MLDPELSTTAVEVGQAGAAALALLVAVENRRRIRTLAERILGQDDG